MSTEQDIAKKTEAASISVTSEPQPENTARACDDEYLDMISHHNEQPARDRPDEQPEPQPAQLTTYDPAGEIPFSNWDGEEGPRP